MPTRTRRTPEQWHELVEQQRASGLSIAEFARQEDLKYQTFFQWCKKIPVSPQESIYLNSAFPDFIEIGTADTSAKAAADWLVELDLGNGVCLRVQQPG